MVVFSSNNSLYLFFFLGWNIFLDKLIIKLYSQPVHCMSMLYWYKNMKNSLKPPPPLPPWTVTVIVSWNTGKNVFHSRPIGLNIFPVLSSFYLECQSSVLYFWMSPWIFLEPDELLDRILDVIFLLLDCFLDVELCFAPRDQDVQYFCATGEKSNF